MKTQLLLSLSIIFGYGITLSAAEPNHSSKQEEVQSILAIYSKDPLAIQEEMAVTQKHITRLVYEINEKDDLIAKANAEKAELQHTMNEVQDFVTSMQDALNEIARDDAI